MTGVFRNSYIKELAGTFNRLFFDVSEKIAKLSYLSELVSFSASFNVIVDIIFPGSSEYYLNWNYFSHYSPVKGKIFFPVTLLLRFSPWEKNFIRDKWQRDGGLSILQRVLLFCLPSINITLSLQPTNIVTWISAEVLWHQ